MHPHLYKLREGFTNLTEELTLSLLHITNDIVYESFTDVTSCAE